MGKSLWKPREDKNSAKVNTGSRTEESFLNKYSEHHMYLEIQHDLERNRASWKLSTWAFTNMRIFKLKQWYFNKFFVIFLFLCIRWMYFSFFSYQGERLETSLFTDNKTLYFLFTFKWKYIPVLFSLYNFKGSFLPLWVFHFFFSILEISDFYAMDRFTTRTKANLQINTSFIQLLFPEV